MVDTKIGNLSDVTISAGVPETAVDPIRYIVVGSRHAHETVRYPDDDLGPISRTR